MQLKTKQNKTKQKNYTEFSHAKTTDNDIDNNNNNNNNNTNNRKLIKKDKTKQRKTLTNIEKYKKKIFS